MRDWFRKIREDKKMTQDEFAKIIGYSQKLVSKIEVGGDIKVSTAKNIAEKLDIEWPLFFKD
jgi:transcriptional regulator with XRE-family HTH domain